MTRTYVNSEKKKKKITEVQAACSHQKWGTNLKIPVTYGGEAFDFWYYFCLKKMKWNKTKTTAKTISEWKKPIIIPFSEMWFFLQSAGIHAFCSKLSGNFLQLSC